MEKPPQHKSIGAHLGRFVKFGHVIESTLSNGPINSYYDVRSAACDANVLLMMSLP